jgi:signal peptidase I
MLSTLRARGQAVAKLLPQAGHRRTPCPCSMMALAGRRGAGGLSRSYAGGTRLVATAGRATKVCSRAEVVALLRRWTSSKASSGSMKQTVAPKLDGWLGMTALEVADAASDPWTAFRMRVAVLVQFGCFLYILNNYGLSSTLCQGPSMMPTLNPAGDVVLVEHVTTTLGWLERGHVVVAKSPTDPNAVVCKRILGLPGDTVSAFGRALLCSGAPPDITFGAYAQVPRDTRYPFFRSTEEDIVVPAGKVWLQGDNIRNSTDSRNYGPVPLPLITGRVFFKVCRPTLTAACASDGGHPGRN